MKTYEELQKEVDKLREALMDCVDGYHVYDLIEQIGLPEERCAEIVNLARGTDK